MADKQIRSLQQLKKHFCHKRINANKAGATPMPIRVTVVDGLPDGSEYPGEDR
jgi:hypothetical protein